MTGSFFQLYIRPVPHSIMVPEKNFVEPCIMTSAQFSRFSPMDQEQLAKAGGVWIACRQEPEFIIHLYQFPDFYVELFYHQIKKTAVHIRSFTDLRGLDGYLNGIAAGFD